MKKFFLAMILTAVFSGYILSQRTSANLVTVTPPPGLVPATPAALPAVPDPAAAGGTPSPNAAAPIPAAGTPVADTPPPSTGSGLYKNGVYTGAVADAYYGNVQVQVRIQNGKITDVQFLDYPHDRSTSRYINSQAMPYLRSEAIQAQSANVDIISGATATSGAFQQSLASALTRAKT